MYDLSSEGVLYPHQCNILSMTAVDFHSHLKNIVLPHLASLNQVEKFCTKRTLSQAEIEQRLQTMSKSARKQQAESLSAPINTWLWRLKPQVEKKVSSREVKTKPSIPSLIVPRLPASSVGVGEDWSHLNKRRQRARKEKVQRDLKWMWTLQDAKRQAARKELELNAVVNTSAA
ncbi:hypothetical protein BJ138DRAFT_1151276 [Hygrophoropsis aurantiaca]|uniref:Uncharacterized protein n=1 Tax=Hygrophoropsis aurantiaca TaxID=72124 RepID=A0ACB8AD19_9AGAM|nr:hypothetical protein BJ138DRAFT_1151276 [Hygrophoropsis aurantiaca]